MSGTETSLIAALALGFFGSSHCLVMCGGISAALGMGSDPARRFRVVPLFQLGRVCSYALLGAGLGAALEQIATLQSLVLPALRVLSGLLLVAMGCYVANWWRGLTVLENLGQHLWRHLQPIAQRRIPLRSSLDAVAVGALWGFLPCGLIYTALAWSATAADWPTSALLMAGFGLGTTPAMLATGLVAQRLSDVLKRQGFRRFAGALLILAGLWTSAIAYQHAGHSPSAGEADAAHHHH